jgi:hypothetical protein
MDRASSTTVGFPDIVAPNIATGALKMKRPANSGP